MSRPDLDELILSRRIERVTPNLGDAEDRWRNATDGMATVQAILAGSAGTTNVRAACLLTWDAALDLVLGWLALFGYRVTSERGHHVSAIEAARVLFDSRPDAIKVVNLVDDLRRLRDRTLYNNVPVYTEDFEPHLAALSRFADWLGKAVLRA